MLGIVPAEDTFNFVVLRIQESSGLVGGVYSLEARLPATDDKPARPDVKVRLLTLYRCAAGAELTATVWYSAWVSSANVELPGWRKAINP